MENPIGHILKSKAMMAPLSGVTDTPFRLLARKHGCKFAFTEMIDSSGILHKNAKTLSMLDHEKDDKPLGVQLAGESEEKLINAARACEDKGFSLLDINAGCPARKVVKAGKGSALLKDTDKLGKIVSGLVKNISIPVTIKIRSGWDDGNMSYLNVAKTVAEAGASAISIHPRTKEQMYKGVPDYEIIRLVKESIKIPVFASGNIFTLEDAITILKETSCDAVLVARGALGSPWIFDDLNNYFETGAMPNRRDIEYIKEVIIEHFVLCEKYNKTSRLFPRMYKHMTWYLEKFKNIDAIMKEYLKIKGLDSLKRFIESISVDAGNRLFIGKD